MRALLLAGVMAIGWAGSAEASYTLTLTQVGPDIIAMGAGSVDISSAQFVGVASPQGGFINPTRGQTMIGTPFLPPYAYGVTATSPFPTSFGSSPDVLVQELPAVGSGGTVGVLSDTSSMAELLLPFGYVSGFPLSSESIFNNATFASAGLTIGTYVYSFGNDTFTIDIEVPVTASVPEPTAVVLLALPMGVAGLIAMGRRKSV